MYGSDDPRVIAAEIDAFCRRELGAAVAGASFHQSSVGCVSGVVLDDGRRVVVKGHQPGRDPDQLREVVRVQRHLVDRGFPATSVCAGPAPLGRGLATVEIFVDRGVTRDAHEPAIRAALARGLAEIVALAAPLVASSTLSTGILLGAAPDALWPTPHSRLFDFAATAAGAEWIDAVARAARAALTARAGEVVIGHGDWRAEHVRFEDERIVAAFDWDSLCVAREPALVGFTAHAYCADWTRAETVAPAPTVDEARAFVAAYEEARGRAFDAAEIRLCAAAFAYSCAYTARCGWAGGADDRERPGNFHALLARHGAGLVDVLGR